MLSVLMLMTASMYVFRHEMISELFSKLGYPSYIIYPLAIAKTLGIVAILSRKSEFLKELAYAGFFFVFVLALSAHLNVRDGGFAPAAVAIALVVSSYVFGKKVFSEG